MYWVQAMRLWLAYCVAGYVTKAGKQPVLMPMPAVHLPYLVMVAALRTLLKLSYLNLLKTAVSMKHCGLIKI